MPAKGGISVADGIDSLLVRSSTGGHGRRCYHYPSKQGADDPLCNRPAKAYLRKPPDVVDRMDLDLCKACQRELERSEHVNG